MTMVRPVASGWIKNMYMFHANVVKSCDMSWYLTMSVGLTDIAVEIMQRKRDACMKMYALYFTEQIPKELIEMVSWTYLFDPWMHYITFHLETSYFQETNYKLPEGDEPECILTEGQEPPFMA